jgi:hypothetical protein
MKRFVFRLNQCVVVEVDDVKLNEGSLDVLDHAEEIIRNHQPHVVCQGCDVNTGPFSIESESVEHITLLDEVDLSY